MIFHHSLQLDSASQLLVKTPYGDCFGVPQQVFDRVWSRLRSPNHNSVLYISMEIGADPDTYHPLHDILLAGRLTSSPDERTQVLLNRWLYGPRKIPNYSGGLGVLAGDTLKSFADLHLPVFAVSLLYREGYFSQFVDSKVGQIAQATQWEPEQTPRLFLLQNPEQPGVPLEITIPFFTSSEQVVTATAQVWMKIELSWDLQYFIPAFLLDFSLEKNPEWIQEAASQLYNANSVVIKANQRRMLGSSILPLKEALGFTPGSIHLNEQHGVTVTLHMILDELRRVLGPGYAEQLTDADMEAAIDEVAEQIVYTIHTPVKAGHDRFSRTFYAKFTHTLLQRILNRLAYDDDTTADYNFTNMAMRVSRAVNSVSRLHRDVTRRQFPDFAEKIQAITNGVHHLTWISDSRAEIFDATPCLAGWRENPGIFSSMDDNCRATISAPLRTAWERDNLVLTEYVNTMLVNHRKQMLETWIDPPNYLSRLPQPDSLEPGVFTLGFARRFSTYKRADLIFDDISTLAALLTDNNWRINIIYAGKAHPADEPGKSVLKLILDNQEELYERSHGRAKLVFIPGYDMLLAKLMVAGVHAWLNSPKRPLEASGTSGMKAAMNGVPNISVMDGWWVEGYHDGQTGWKFGYEGPVDEASLSEDPETLLYEEDSSSFYGLLPEVLDCFYNQPQQFMERAINNLQMNIPIFNTHRMGAEYAEKYNLDLDEHTSSRLHTFQALYQSDNTAP
ncbi:MAG: alpha-glucan phosphorylase [Desulfobulbus propionicus]|nr:MAG: alpha-glucan phosphorylase [Desulfobulbus propionicus]